MYPCCSQPKKVLLTWEKKMYQHVILSINNNVLLFIKNYNCLEWIIFLHYRYKTPTCLSPGDEWCLDSLDLEDWWISLGLAPIGGGWCVDEDLVAEAAEAVGPEMPWLALDWNCLGISSGSEVLLHGNSVSL